MWTSPARRGRWFPVALLQIALGMQLMPGAASAQTSEVSVSPITAYLDRASVTTEYTVQVAAPIGAEIDVVWSTPSCGEWSRPVPTLFRWTHEHPPCTDDLLHPGVVISVVVTVASADVEFTCRYRGADSGTGKDCQRRSLGLTPSPTPTAASPTPPPTTAAPTAAPADPGLQLPPVLLPAALGVLALVSLVILTVSLVRRRRRRREADLDPCGPRQRRGLAYLVGEIAAYADCNRQAVERALASASMEGTRTRIDLGDLWDAPAGERPTWAGVVAGEGLMRPVRDPDIVAAAAPLLGPDGAWRAAAEKVAPRLIRRSYQGYGEEDAGRWSGAVDALVERLRPSCASDGAAAAIAANAFALAAIAAADALARMNEASEGSGCPPVAAPDVVFATIPAAAVDPAAPGDALVRSPIRGGAPTSEPLADATRP